MQMQSLRRLLVVALISWFHLQSEIDWRVSEGEKKKCFERNMRKNIYTWNVVGPDVDDDCTWLDPITLDELGFPNSRNKYIGPSDLNQKRTNALRTTTTRSR